MILFLRIVVILMGVSMFFISREKKMSLMFVACMNFTALAMWDKSVNYYLFLFFIFSECFNFVSIKNKFKDSPVLDIIQLLCISGIIAIIFSPHLHTVNAAYNFVLKKMFLCYFSIGYSFYLIGNKGQFKTFIKFTIIPMLLLTVLGIINMVEHKSSFISMMSSGNQTFRFVSGDYFSQNSRFRVQAMFSNPFDYGYMCGLCLLVYLYAYINRIIGKYIFFVLMACSFFGIFMCGARTVLLCTICSVILFLVLTYNVRSYIRIAIVVFVVCVFAYFTIPIVRDKFDQLLLIFSDTEGREISGSSIEMRSVQLAAVLKYIQNNILFGRGVYFFGIDLGWSKGDLVDSDLYGLESVCFSYLLERGFVGYILYLLVWLKILYLLIRARKIDFYLANMGLAIWALYTIFANMTGELLSVYPTLFILGSILGICYNKTVKYVV